MTQFLNTADNTPLSRFCFGTMQFGGNADVVASTEMFSACRTAGINFFDTAYGYTEGRSEMILGQLAAPERESLFLATKCAYEGGAGRENILTQFDQSLSRLQSDYVDLLYLHRWNDTPLEETFDTLAGLCHDGKVRHVGVSNFAAWQVVKAQNVARSFGIAITFLQPMYNLVKRQAEVELFPMAVAEGIAVCPYSPLGGGLLTGKYAKGDNGRLKTDDRYATRYGEEWMHEVAAALADLADELGVSPATLAVAWVARNPAVYAPIISARSLDQLQPSLDAITFPMDDALYARISALSRRPAPATDRTEEA